MWKQRQNHLKFKASLPKQQVPHQFGCTARSCHKNKDNPWPCWWTGFCLHNPILTECYQSNRSGTEGRSPASSQHSEGFTYQTLLHSGHDAGRSTAFVQCHISHKGLFHNAVDPVHHSLQYSPTNRAKGDMGKVQPR